MVDVRKVFEIEPLANKSYRKCGACGRVKSLYFRLTIKDTKTGDSVIATLLLCDCCGGVFSDVIGRPTPSARRRIKL